jgi:hypothetical protein
MPNNPMQGSYYFKRLPDGTIQMKDLRSIDEQIAQVVLTDAEKINRLCNHIVSLENVVQTITEDNNKIIEDLHARIHYLEPYAGFYKQLQESILSNPTLQIEWERFCLLLKMVDPDADKDRG